MTNSQADKMIDEGRSLKEIARLFPDKIATAQYFADYMAARFSVADQFCVSCGKQSDAPPLAFRWHANLHTAKTIVLSFVLTAVSVLAHHIHSRWIVVEFYTSHRLCSKCRSRFRIRGAAIAVLNKILFAFLILLVFVTVPCIVFLFVAIFIAPEMRGKMLFGTFTGLALLGLLVWGFEFCRKVLIPPGIRGIGRFPFSLSGMQDK